MKAISLWQPWASLIACGDKPFETRSWAPPRALIGHPVAIHAAKKVDRAGVELAEDVVFGDYGVEVADRLEASHAETGAELFVRFGEVVLPVGCIVAIGVLEAAFQLGEPAEGTAVPAARVVRRLVSRPVPDCFTVRYDEFGDYSPGRWAWLFRDVKPLRPHVPAVGHQGFFDLPQGWLCP